jgi:hypothetical protein
MNNFESLYDLKKLMECKDKIDSSENFLKCRICGSKDCYDLIASERGIIKVVFQRGVIFLCRRCYKDSIFFDNLSWRIMLQILKLKRIFKL